MRSYFIPQIDLWLSLNTVVQNILNYLLNFTKSAKITLTMSQSSSNTNESYDEVEINYGLWRMFVKFQGKIVRAVLTKN